MQDREGTLWIGTRDHGVFRLRDGQVTSHSARDGLPGNAVDSLYQDPEGDVWIGTDGSGVAQLRDGRMRAFSVNDGVPDNNVRSIIEDPAGALWIGTARGLARFRSGAFSVVFGG